MTQNTGDEILTLREWVKELERRLENAELRADKVRLDWLQSHATSQIDWEDNGRTGRWYGAGETLRSAIDAAREDADE